MSNPSSNATPHPALRATLSPPAGRGALDETLLPARGEKVPEGRMRGASFLAATLLLAAACTHPETVAQRETVEAPVAVAQRTS